MTTASFLEATGLTAAFEEDDTVVTTKMELLELLSKAEGGDADFLREGVRVLAQALMDLEVTAQIGAEHGQTGARAAQRPAQWVPGAGLRHPRGHDRAGHPQAASGQLLPLDPGAAPAG